MNGFVNVYRRGEPNPKENNTVGVHQSEEGVFEWPEVSIRRVVDSVFDMTEKGGSEFSVRRSEDVTTIFS